MTDYEKFYEAMKMLQDNKFVSTIEVDTVGANNNTVISVYRSDEEEDDGSWLAMVFDSDGNFDHEV